MDRRVLFDFRCVSVEVLNAFDGRKRRFLRRKGAIPFERDDDVFVADEALAREAVPWWHVVDFGIHDLLACDLAELPQQLLLFLGQRNAMLRLRRDVLDLDKTGSAFAVLTVKRNRNAVRLCDGQNGPPMPRHRVDRDVLRHDRGLECYVSHELLSFLFRAG